MSFAFQHHGYDLSAFERCERHGCILMQITADAKPTCLVEWLLERAGGRRVTDVILREPGEYNVPAVILDNGFMLPVQQLVDMLAGKSDEVSLRLAGWQVTDILYVQGEKNEGVALELRPEGAGAEDEDPGALLQLHMDIVRPLAGAVGIAQ